MFAGVAGCIAYYKGFVFHAIVQSCENRIKLRRLVRIVPASQPFPHQQTDCEDGQEKYRSFLHTILFPLLSILDNSFFQVDQLVSVSCSTRRAELPDSRFRAAGLAETGRAGFDNGVLHNKFKYTKIFGRRSLPLRI